MSGVGVRIYIFGLIFINRTSSMNTYFIPIIIYTVCENILFATNL